MRKVLCSTTRSCRHLTSWRFNLLILTLCLHAIRASLASSADSGKETWEIEAVMPEHPAPAETYLCMRVDLPAEGSLKLVGVEPLSSQELVHHMLLYGCQHRTDTQGVWRCEGHGVCPSGGNQQILYGWAKGAPAVRLPNGVGYRVGSGTQIDNLVLQIHFAVERPPEDTSGVRLHVTSAHVPFSAGMLMYASYFEVPPRRERHLVPTRCCYAGFEPAHAFAFRVHTHALGRSVFLDEISRNGSRSQLVEHDPQLPQGFTPVSGLTLWPGQTLEATCAFDSTSRAETTYAGATHHNEMCNLYMITWSELPVFMSCYGGWTPGDRHGAGGVPQPAALLAESPEHWRPPQPLADPGAAGAPRLGQVAGVAKGHNGTVWVFHRGDRVWDGASFVGPKLEHTTAAAPIAVDTVLQLDQDTGQVLASWGKDFFYMPHMIYIDPHGHVWLTDVGLHQVFKFDAAGKQLMVLGERLKPGNGSSFCKPTDVAIGKEGDIYVSDGYCNARVAHFSADGTHVGDLETPRQPMRTPHSVVLEGCSDDLFVADREASKVHRFWLQDGTLSGTWDLSKEGLVFALAKGPYGTLFALCWHRDRLLDPSARLVLLHSDPGQGVEASWVLEGVDSVHSLAILAGPARLAASERPLAAVVGETRLMGSRLQKFILMPAGVTSLPAVEADPGLGSAVEQWRAVRASALQAGGGPPAQHRTTAHAPPQEVLEDFHHAADGAAAAELQHGTHPGLANGTRTAARAAAPFELEPPPPRPRALVTLVSIPLLVCCGAVALAYRFALARR